MRRQQPQRRTQGPIRSTDKSHRRPAKSIRTAEARSHLPTTADSPSLTTTGAAACSSAEGTKGNRLQAEAKGVGLPPAFQDSCPSNDPATTAINLMIEIFAEVIPGPKVGPLIPIRHHLVSGTNHRFTTEVVERLLPPDLLVALTRGWMAETRATRPVIRPLPSIGSFRNSKPVASSRTMAPFHPVSMLDKRAKGRLAIILPLLAIPHRTTSRLRRTIHRQTPTHQRQEIHHLERIHRPRGVLC